MRKKPTNLKRKSESFDASILPRSQNLCKIDEAPNEKEDEEPLVFRKLSTHKITLGSTQIPTLPAIVKDVHNEQVVFFHNFFTSLRSIPVLYKYFRDQAIKSEVISQLRTEFESPRFSKSRYVSTLNSPRVKTTEEMTLELNLIQEEVLPQLTKAPSEMKPREPSRRLSSKDSLISNAIGPSKPQIKLPVLDKNSSSLFEKFKQVAGAIDSTHKDYKLNWDSYKEYLALRYPPEMVELMLKWLYHGMSVSFEGWVIDVQKFINFPCEKHFKLAFELYDFNKDHYLCNTDVFHVMSLQNSLIFDNDIIRIRKAFEFKSTNEHNEPVSPKRKQIRKNNEAFMTPEEEIKFKVPAVHLTKSEALTLDDFNKIQFLYERPQIIIDLVRYLTDLDIGELNTEIVKVQKRKKSEEIVEEMIFNNEFRERLKEQNNYSYYADLETIMLMFPVNYPKLLFEKYNDMCISKSSKIIEISLNSISEKFPKYFGAENPYICSSFYNYLSGRKHLNITKTSYLTSLLLLFDVKLTQEETQNEFAFSMYDRNQDGLITCEEINYFFSTVSESTFIYKECLM